MINVVLEDENGRHFEKDGTSVLLPQRILPALEDLTFVCLRFVDPYGDTVFNRLQIPFLLKDIERLKTAVKEEDLVVLDGLQRCAEVCLGKIHTYLRFIGD